MLPIPLRQSTAEQGQLYRSVPNLGPVSTQRGVLVTTRVLIPVALSVTRGSKPEYRSQAHPWVCGECQL